MPDTSTSTDLWQQAIRAQAPESAVVIALQITHPDITTPIRVVNDARDHVIGGENYIALTFGARLADDVEGQVPRAELVMDNVGAALTQWIEASGGGAGAAVRMMSVSVSGAGATTVEWALDLDIVGMTVTHHQVTARLGFDPVLHRPAVQIRHDPSHSPGLF